MRIRTKTAGRALRLLPKAMTVGILLNGVRLRQRAAALGRLDDGEGADAAEAAEIEELLHEWVFVTAAGIELDETTRRSAIRYAISECLDVVDLVPGDLPVERAFEMLRLTDVRTYRTDPLVTGRGAFQALVVAPEVAARAGLERITDLDPFEMVKVTAELKRFAPWTTDLAVAPLLRATPDEPRTRKAFLRGLWGGAGPGVHATPAIEWGALAVGAAADRRWGAAAIAAYTTQPLVTLAGRPGDLRPRDLAAHASQRPWREPRHWYRSIRSSWRSPAEQDLHEELRPVYADLLADGIDHFFEPRRDSCPWCDGRDLSERIRVTDHYQHKPGTFVMDECADCGVVFQNPRLTPDGLDFYYRDFYDGLGGDQLESVFGASTAPYTGRAEMVRSHGDPKRWLDVGTGHGHFCLMAKQTWPDTSFDGLDMGDAVADAERRGWIDQAHRGMFPDLAHELVGTYDVVSMHHYLEHTRSPVAELAAADQVLVPGGLLLIEVPDPESRWGRVLGGAWLPWFQPQHQQMIPRSSLTARLEADGYTILDHDQGEGNKPVELLAASFFAVDALAPDPKLPWGPEFTRARWARRMAVLTLATPVILGAFVTDRLIGRLVEGPDHTNAYRVLARKPE